MLTPEDVFVTDGYPEHTYLSSEEGKKEAELRDGLSQQNIIFILGPKIRSVLQQYSRLFKDQALPLDRDEEKRRLTVVDAHFYFFLRNTPKEHTMQNKGNPI